MQSIFESLLPVFLLICLGAALRRIDLVPRDMWSGFERIAYWVFFPALLIETLVTADLNAGPVAGLTLAMLAAVLCLCLITFLLRPFIMGPFKLSGPSFTSVFQTATRWNAFIAIAIIARLYGDEGLTLVAVAMAVMVPILNVLAVAVLAIYASSETPGPLSVIKTVAKNPFIWSCIVGITINLLEIPIYEPLLHTADILGRSALGAGLLLVGGGLMIRHAFRPPFVVVIPTVLKLLIMPLLVGVFCYLFGVTGDALAVALVCGAVPTAMNGYVLARQMGGDATLYATITVIQTVLSFLTIPLILALVEV